MSAGKTEIIVFAHWEGMTDPVKMGKLIAQHTRGHLAWSFEYYRDWLTTQSQYHLDPDLQWFGGPQYSQVDKPNFGIFLDSMPDSWGRMLMKKREALQPSKNGKRRRLSDIDFLLGAYSLRFSHDHDRPL
jgi:serine/threonine-protein kinase HipA